MPNRSQSAELKHHSRVYKQSLNFLTNCTDVPQLNFIFEYDSVFVPTAEKLKSEGEENMDVLCFPIRSHH